MLFLSVISALGKEPILAMFLKQMVSRGEWIFELI